jgi:hypothetical protein
MFHLNTELLIDYWRKQRGERPLPARSDIDPAAFFPLASRVFIAVLDKAGDYRFRLAGETLIDLHGRILAGADLLPLWRPEHRQPMRRTLDAALSASATVVATARARTDRDAEATLEILFAPLSGADGRPDRFLGLYQPLTPIASLNGRPIRDLSLRGINGAEDSRRPNLRLAAVDGRRIA